VLKSSITRARLPKAARRNRNMLIRLMSGFGFANYRREWWHWSYGDWGWALANRRKPIYGPCERTRRRASAAAVSSL
jgi:D-alanyl-D-alanine dipeptidase